MNQTCDRCGPAVRAAYLVDRTGELYLRGHYTSPHWPALSAQGGAPTGPPPGVRPHPGRALVSDPGRLGLVCPC